MKPLKNNYGLSLLEVVIVASILGFLGLAMSTTFTDLFKMQSKISGADEANDFGSSVGRFLYTQETCSRALVSQSFPVKGSRDLSLSSYKLYDASGKEHSLEKNSPMGAKLRVTQLTLEDKGMPAIDVVQSGVTYKRYVAKISLTTESKVGAEWRANKPRVFEFPLLTDASGIITQCSSSSTVEDACRAIGTKLDENGNCVPDSESCYFEGHYTTNYCDGVASACEPSPKMCADGSVCPQDDKCRASHKCTATGICADGITACTPGDDCEYVEDCLPAVTCDNTDHIPPGCPSNQLNEITGKASCKHASSSRQTGAHTWSYVAECGKKCTKTINVETKYFICLRCDDAKK